jgi:sodium-dependent dicarboxylate transporter 2/3/5
MQAVDVEPGGVLSPAEERFERARRTIGLFAGPLVFALMWALPTPSLTVPAHRLAAVVSLVVVWWVTEAIPIPATALVGAVLAVVCGVASATDVFAPFASPTIFLFMGSFMIGRAVSDHGLDRRLAFTLLSLRSVQGSAPRIAMAIGLLTVAISAWMSNTATTAMMMPVAMGVLSAIGATRGAPARSVATPMLLSVAYAASVGGIMTPVGTPPNLIAIGLLERVGGIRIPFFSWMVMAVPIGLALAAVLMTMATRRVGGGGARGMAAAVGREPPAGWTTGQRNCAIAFGLAVVGWVTPGAIAVFGSTASPLYRLLAGRLDEAVVAVAAAALLFVLPTDWRARTFTLDWSSAARIDWGTILLFGGGLSLGGLMFSTGLAREIGTRLVALSGAESLWSVTAISIAIAIVLTEITSNTAATNMLVPVVLSICQAQGVNPIPPTVGTALGASMAFMLPISTPPNAIVYGSGLIPVTTMIRYGVMFDLVAFVILFVGLRILCPILGYQ